MCIFGRFGTELLLYPSKNHKCTFIVDTDFDAWLDKKHTIKGLRYTEFPSLECYFFQPEIIQDILRKTSKYSNTNGTIYSSLLDVLVKLFATRICNDQLKLGLSYLEPERCLLFSNDQIAIDFDEYVKRYLNKSERNDIVEEFKANCMQWIDKFVGDPLNSIHGHDYTKILAYLIKKLGGTKSYQNQDAIEVLLKYYVCSIDRLINLVS